MDSTTTSQQRQVLGAEVRRVIEQLVQVGNREFNGRYLFAGSTAGAQPFEYDGPYVTYHGNEGQLSSYVDVGFLTETNLTGEDVFGAISPEVRGTAALTPTVTSATRLDDLRGGAGIRGTSFVISDGNSRQTIDLTGAKTLGDVVRILQDNPPEGRQLNVRLTATGLSLDIDDAGGGNLTVEEVAGGTTAADLGILEPDGTGVAPLRGPGPDTTPPRHHAAAGLFWEPRAGAAAGERAA